MAIILPSWSPGQRQQQRDSNIVFPDWNPGEARLLQDEEERKKRDVQVKQTQQTPPVQIKEEVKDQELKTKPAGQILDYIFAFRKDNPQKKVADFLAQAFITRPLAGLMLSIKRVSEGEDRTPEQKIQDIKEGKFVKLGPSQEWTPSNDMEREIFGNEPIKDIRESGIELATSLGLSREKAEEMGTPLAVAFGLIDLTPPFKLGKAGAITYKTVAEAVSKTSDIATIAKSLKTIAKGTDEEIEAMAQGFKNLNDSKEIEEILTKVSTEQDRLKTLAQKTTQQKAPTRQNVVQKQESLIREGTEELEARRVSAEIAQQERSLYSTDQIININRLKKVASSTEAQSGDIETLRRLNPKLTDDVIGSVRETHPGIELTDEQAIDMALGLPTKAQTVIKTPDALREARSLNDKVKVFNQGVREGRKIATDEISVLQNDLVEFMKNLPVSERGKMQLISGIKQANSVVKLNKQLERVYKALEKVEKKKALTQPVKSFKQGLQEGFTRGKKIGRAQAENVAQTKIEKAVRREQSKMLRGGIEIRAEKDKIINFLRSSVESTSRIKKMITEYAVKSLERTDRGKAITLVRDAKTRRDLTKAFARIDRWAEDAIKKDLRDEILKTQKKLIKSPSMAVDYKSRISQLLNDFELKGHRKTTIEKLRKTQDFLEKEIAKGSNVDMPMKVLKSLSILTRTPFDQMTINQLKGLKTEIDMLESLGRTKARTLKQVWELQKERVIRDVASQKVKPIEKIEIIRPEIGERLTVTQKFKNLIWSTINTAARIDRAISPMDVVFDLLDGGKALYNGANFRYFKARVDAGYGRYITRKDSIQEPVISLINKYKLKDTNLERMGVVAAREQDGGMEKLIASGFTEKQINAVRLTTQEQEVLDLMRKTFDSQFPEIQDIMRRVYNQPVEKVKNYFSFMTDWKAMDDAEVFQRFGSNPLDSMGNPASYGAPKKNVKADFTKKRVGGDQKIKINALDVFLQHTDNTSYLIELGETTKMLGEIAASPEYAKAVGEAGQLMVREWLDVVARKGGAAGAQEIAVLDTLRKNVGIGILGAKLSTIMIQPTAFIDGIGFIGSKYATKGFSNFTTSSDWRKFVLNMPEIKDRIGGEFALRELTDSNFLQKIQRKGFIPMQMMDQITASSIAAGAYERKMIELGREINFTKYDKEALEYAQLAVRRTQSSGSFKDVPLAVSRGALTGNLSLDRAILQFQNFLLTRWSRVRHDALRAGVNERDPRKAVPIFTAIIMASLAGSGIRIGVNTAQDFITGRERDDDIQSQLQSGFVYEMTGTVPFLGTAISMAMYDGEMFPILDAPKGTISGLNRVVTSKSEAAKLRGLSEFAGSVGSILGIPGSAQAESIARGVLQDKESGSSSQKQSIGGLNFGFSKSNNLSGIKPLEFGF